MFNDKTLSEILNIFSDINNITETIIKIPSIVMLGSQSSGKSIILSRLINFTLPSGTGMVTRRPTIIYLIKSEKIEINIIEEGENKKTFSNYNLSYELIKEKISILTEKELIIKFSGPKLFPIKLIDLPGLIRFNNEEEETCKIIEDINIKYLNDTNNLILNVINGNVDFHTIESLYLNKKIDPKFLRSFFVVTKLDLISLTNNNKIESPELINLIEFLKNKKFKTKNGFCGIINIKNKLNDYEKMKKEEKDFINKSIFKKIKEVGIDFLIEKLKNIYFIKLKENIPNLEKKLKNLLKENKLEFKKEKKSLNYENKIYNLILIKFNNDIKNILNLLLLKEKETNTFHLKKSSNLKEEINRLFLIKKNNDIFINKNCNIFNFKEVFESYVLENIKEQETHLIQQFILLKSILKELIKDIVCDFIEPFLLKDLKKFVIKIFKKRTKKIKQFLKKVLEIEKRFINFDLLPNNINNINICSKENINDDNNLNKILNNFSLKNNKQVFEETYELKLLRFYYKIYCERISNKLIDTFKKIMYLEIFIYFEEKMPIKYIYFMEKYFKKRISLKIKDINNNNKYLENINNISNLLIKLNKILE